MEPRVALVFFQKCPPSFAPSLPKMWKLIQYSTISSVTNNPMAPRHNTTQYSKLPAKPQPRRFSLERSHLVHHRRHSEQRPHSSRRAAQSTSVRTQVLRACVCAREAKPKSHVQSSVHTQKTRINCVIGVCLKRLGGGHDGTPTTVEHWIPAKLNYAHNRIETLSICEGERMNVYHHVYITRAYTQSSQHTILAHTPFTHSQINEEW